MSRGRDTSPSGLSLIELVVAMAIFALVAVMGLQSLSGTLRLRDRMSSTADQTAELAAAVAALRADLKAAVPLGFYAPGQSGLPASAIALEEGRLSLSLAGQPGLPPWPADGGMHRAVWQLERESGALTRRVWPTLSPAEAEQLSPAVPVLGGVTGWELRSHWPEIGWVPGLRNPTSIAAAPDEPDGDVVSAREIYSSALPLAVEITLRTQSWGPITLIEALQ